jgi:hypothetical protein
MMDRRRRRPRRRIAIAGSVSISIAASASFLTLGSAFFACVGDDPPFVVGNNGEGGSNDDASADSSGRGNDSGNGNGDDTGTGPDGDAGANKSDACPDPAAKISIAFATAFEMAPNFGGAVGADDKCAIAAIDGGLSGTFRAWISSDGTSAAIRIIDPDPSRPIALVGPTGDRPVIAACAAKLASGGLAHAIDRNQRGETVSATPTFQVWTGTYADGGLGSDAGCSDWTARSSAGVIGDARNIDRGWTEFALKSCAGDARLYCIQVP